VIVGTVLFAVQIYCDFSGYSDIARGISKLFGVNLIVNFNLPYFAKDPQDFWRRWHISLSTWLRDYLYIALGGNRGSLTLVCRNLMITMLLGGLWHGAAWNYVLWGFYHGSLLCASRIWDHYRPRKRDDERTILFNLAAGAGFFAITCYGWLLFRARSLSQVVDFTGLLVTDFGNLNYGAGIPRMSAILGIALLVVMEIVQHWRRDDPHYYRHYYAVLQGFALAAMLLFTTMGLSNEPAQFIYFQF
jgi:alginate O-acetyltransferase complex protein AlgI